MTVEGVGSLLAGFSCVVLFWISSSYTSTYKGISYWISPSGIVLSITAFVKGDSSSTLLSGGTNWLSFLSEAEDTGVRDSGAPSLGYPTIGSATANKSETLVVSGWAATDFCTKGGSIAIGWLTSVIFSFMIAKSKDPWESSRSMRWDMAMACSEWECTGRDDSALIGIYCMLDLGIKDSHSKLNITSCYVMLIGRSMDPYIGVSNPEPELVKTGRLWSLESSIGGSKAVDANTGGSETTSFNGSGFAEGPFATSDCTGLSADPAIGSLGLEVASLALTSSVLVNARKSQELC